MADRARRLIALGAGAWALAGCEPGNPIAPFHAIDITGANYAQDFDLPDTDGRRRHLADFRGRVVLVFFGYTQCPDVCPTTLGELAQVKQALGADGQRVQGIFVTVDPERDSPQILKAYVGAFGGDFVALRGSAEETRTAAKDFKVFYAKVPGASAGSYTMDHTAGSYVFDARGRVRLFTRYGSGAEALKQDLQRLLAEKG
jgi:protein SCO1/2